METTSQRTPKVTVIVPNYNHARYLPQRLESVFGQTYQDFELIVLDDASTDQSVAVLQPYAVEGRIRLVVNEQNSGSPFAQWARGAALARGELLWIAESDDSADPTLLERLVAVLVAHPRVGLAYCQSRCMDAEGKLGESCEKWNHGLDPARWTANYTHDGRDEVARYLAVHNTIPNASGVLLRTALLRRAVVGAEAFRLSGDWRAWIDILLEADVAFVADPLNYFRIHDRSVRDNTHQDQACAEFLAVKAYACGRAAASAAVRKRTLRAEFPRWVRCLNADGLVARRSWLAQTLRHGFSISMPGGFRMLGSVFATLARRTFWHRLVRTRPASVR